MNGQTDPPGDQSHEPNQPAEQEDKTHQPIKLTQEEHHAGLTIIRNFLKSQNL